MSSKLPALHNLPRPILEITDAELQSGETRLIPLIRESKEHLYVEEGLAVMRHIFEQCCRMDPSLASARFVNPRSDVKHYTMEIGHV